jgi:xanthine dehydrogenase YagT iron-sulfur-binding subunit
MSNKDNAPGVSRRDFLKISGIAASVPLVIGPTVIEVAGEQVPVHGPDAVPVNLVVNGKRLTTNVEPRMTLLDTLRENLDITGPKRVCDRGECGACTVLIDGKAVYSCTTLAIEAQGKQIVTAEGLAGGMEASPVQAAFVNNDAQQCGFCTPGFTIAATAFLKQHPKATDEQVAEGLAGNFCRCGTYRGIHGVVAQVAGRAPHGNAETGGTVTASMSTPKAARPAASTKGGA